MALYDKAKYSASCTSRPTRLPTSPPSMHGHTDAHKDARTRTRMRAIGGTTSRRPMPRLCCDGCRRTMPRRRSLGLAPPARACMRACVRACVHTCAARPRLRARSSLVFAFVYELCKQLPHACMIASVGCEEGHFDNTLYFGRFVNNDDTQNCRMCFGAVGTTVARAEVHSGTHSNGDGNGSEYVE